MHERGKIGDIKGLCRGAGGGHYQILIFQMNRPNVVNEKPLKCATLIIAQEMMGLYNEPFVCKWKPLSSVRGMQIEPIYSEGTTYELLAHP